jgi:hypothetical protein
MSKIFLNRKHLYGFGILTGLFVLLNLVTISWAPLPWFDEVWFVDTAVNYALNESWTTTAQISFGGETPIALYPPLYQYLLAGWIKITGFSILSVRSFNIIIAAIISFVLFKGLNELGYLKSGYAILIFVFLFWGTGLFSWSYRNGRPDMVNLLFSSLFLYSYCIYLKRNYGKWLVLTSAALILLSGLQSCPFIVCFLLYMYLVKKKYRDRTKVAFFMTVAGFMAGLISLWGHFVYNEHPNSFFWQFSQSSTISGLIQKIPFFSQYIQPGESGRSITHEILDCYTKNKNYFFLTIVNVAVLFWLLIKKKCSYESLEVYIIGFSLLMPIIMAFAGHCLSPYTWMFYFPAVVFGIICMEKYNRKWIWITYGILTIAFSVVSGLPRTLMTADRATQKRITEFVERQNFKKNVVMLSSYSAYYPIRKITRNSYYSVYPVSYIPLNVEYVLKDETDGHSGNYENFDRYILEKGYKLVPVDSLMQPKTVLYKVMTE